MSHISRRELLALIRKSKQELFDVLDDNTIIVSLEKSDGADCPLFEAFWSEYPARKRDKEKCKSFFSKLKHELQVQIVEDVKTRKVSHRDWVKDNFQYVPAPIVYLRSGRWEEAIVQVSGGRPAAVIAPINKYSAVQKKTL